MSLPHLTSTCRAEGPNLMATVDPSYCGPSGLDNLLLDDTGREDIRGLIPRGEETRCIATSVEHQFLTGRSWMPSCK